MSIRTRCTQIFAFYQQNKSATIREAAAATGASKSAVHRHQQAIKNRNLYPESLSWETQAGQVWFTTLVCATLYVFGIRCGVGMETISEFFKLLRLEKQATHLSRDKANISMVYRMLPRQGQFSDPFDNPFEGYPPKAGHFVPL